MNALGTPILRNITRLSLQPSSGSLKEWVTYGTLRVHMHFSTTMSLANENLSPKEGKMCAWQIHSYGGLDELKLSCTVRDPIISKPDDVLVNVAATSVNPIDAAIMRGYGNILLNKMRGGSLCESEKDGIEFPLTLGRDFSGQVIAVGQSVTSFKPGDEVWGVISPSNQGCHSQRVAVSQSNIRPKPKNLNMEEAASILYAAVTAWGALRVSGDLLITGARGKRILVIGAAGGVGSVAVQMAKAWGAQVVGTCRSDAIPLVESLGADAVIDYTSPSMGNRLQSEGPFDIALDAAGIGSDASQYTSTLKQWSNAKYITLRSPLLTNIDQHGMLVGALRSAADLIQHNIMQGTLHKGASLRWGFFTPCDAALDEIQLLAEAGKITPCIQKIYTFKEVPQAFQHIMGGHIRGKIVITLKSE